MIPGRLFHRFVSDVPESLAPMTLYVSVTHSVAVHLCACGCGNEVVTPIAPGGWTVGWNGETVSLSPSVGSVNLACASHYLVRSGRVLWLAPMGTPVPAAPPPSRLRAIAAATVGKLRHWIGRGAGGAR